MKVFSQTVLIKTKKVFDFLVVNKEIEKIVALSGIKNGFVLLRSPHNTATMICNENDPRVLNDLKNVFEKLLPDDFNWQHSYEGINNARAHQVVALLGQTHWLPVENGQLKLGSWQSIFLVEFFQARKRKIEVMVVGE